MIKPLLVGIGGFFGAISRYLVDGWTSTIVEKYFQNIAIGAASGTIIVNVSGSFLLGFLFASFLKNLTNNQNLNLLIATGFIGAYTTFSTYMLDSIKLADTSSLAIAATNIFASLLFGLIAIYLGLALGKTFS